MKLTNLVRIHLLFIIAACLFPPYYVIEETDNPDYMHESLGFHPVWNKPNIDSAINEIEIKYERQISDELKSNFTIEFNKVNFVINFIILLLLFTPFYIFEYRKAKRVKT